LRMVELVVIASMYTGEGGNWGTYNAFADETWVVC
jgi:hypothetical protein